MSSAIVNLPIKKRLYDLTITPSEWNVFENVNENGGILGFGGEENDVNAKPEILLGSEDSKIIRLEDQLKYIGIDGTLFDPYYYIDLPSDWYTPNSKLEIDISETQRRRCRYDGVVGFIPVNYNGVLKILSLSSTPTINILVHCEIDEVNVVD